MNKRERRILYTAHQALYIPHQNNRMSARGAAQYDEDMRGILRAFAGVVEALLYGELPEAERWLSTLCHEHARSCERAGVGIVNGAVRDYLREEVSAGAIAQPVDQPTLLLDEEKEIRDGNTLGRVAHT